MRRLDVLREQSLQDWKDRKGNQSRLAYERKIVRKLLTTVGADSLMFSLNKPGYADVNTEEYLTFGWLYDTFPGLPVRFVAHEIWKPDLSAFFKVTQRKNQFWSKWKDTQRTLKLSSKETIGVGCVFPTSEACGLKDMILHDLSLATHVSDLDYVRMQRITPEGEVFTLERFVDFVERFKHVWSLS